MVLALQHGLPIQVLALVAEPTATMTKDEFRAHIRALAEKMGEIERPFEPIEDATGEDYLIGIDWLEMMQRIVTGPLAKRLQRCIEQDTPELAPLFKTARLRASNALLEHIELAQQQIDGMFIDAAQAEGGESVPWEAVREELGLD